MTTIARTHTTRCGRSNGSAGQSISLPGANLEHMDC